MKKTAKILLCLLLVSAFCLSMLVGCGGNEEPKETTGTTESSEVESLTETESKVNDEDTLKEYDFGGEEYRILTRDVTDYEFDPNSSYGIKTVNTAIFTRNEEVKNRFNVNILYDKTDGGWGSGTGNNKWIQKYETVTQSGWSDYELTAAHFSLQQFCSLKGLTYDMTELETIDMTKEWWSEQFYENCYINGKFYVAVGDIAHTLYEYIQVVFFNETMAESYIKDAVGNPVDLYELVKNNEWTWEKMKTYSLTINHATDDDPFGLLWWGHSVRGLLITMEMDVLEEDASGSTTMYSFPDSLSEKTLTYANEIIDYLRTNMGVTWHGNQALGGRSMQKVFGDGDALFCATSLGFVVEIAETLAEGQTYGVLPLPMADEDQLEYHTVMRDTMTGVSVPKNLKDPELCGVVTEALCMYGYQHVRPTYLNVVLDGRYMVNDDLGYVMDLLRETVTVDFLYAFNVGFNPYPYSQLSDLVEYHKGTEDYATRYAKNLSSYRESLKTIYAAFGVTVK